VTQPTRGQTGILTVVKPVEMDAELERKNLVFGLALFALFLLLFVAVVVAAFVYLALA
jgi:hypothetical protein